MQAPLPLLCEIHAAETSVASALAEIAGACSRDLGVPLEVKQLVEPAPKHTARASTDAVLTLHLPAEFAADQHQVWCLACRLACFCPSARVSVLVLGQSLFNPRPSRRSRSA